MMAVQYSSIIASRGRKQSGRADGGRTTRDRAHGPTEHGGGKARHRKKPGVHRRMHTQDNSVRPPHRRFRYNACGASYIVGRFSAAMISYASPGKFFLAKSISTPPTKLDRARGSSSRSRRSREKGGYRTNMQKSSNDVLLIMFRTLLQHGRASHGYCRISCHIIPYAWNVIFAD